MSKDLNRLNYPKLLFIVYKDFDSLLYGVISELRLSSYIRLTESITV